MTSVISCKICALQKTGCIQQRSCIQISLCQNPRTRTASGKLPERGLNATLEGQIKVYKTVTFIHLASDALSKATNNRGTKEKIRRT